MLLVVGGQLDPNIGALLRRVLERRIAFRDLLVGPDLTPRVSIDVASGALRLNGEDIDPGGCFIRHDVFMHQESGESVDYAAALNWFYALRGWALCRPQLRLFNRHSYLSENNKLENLRLAATVGLDPPETMVTNEFTSNSEDLEGWIQKPVAGGSYTTTLANFLVGGDAKARAYPRFIQRRLQRPEFRVYRIGPALFGFELASPELDYRTTQRVTIEPAAVPATIAERLIALCDRLGLDFGAADFMRDADGSLRFLEVNSQPMFAAFDRMAAGALSDAIIDHLLHQP